MAATFPRATELAQQIVAGRVRAGDWVVDATCGNGYDTVFLARLVGSTGRVTAVDLQVAAVAATRERLADEGLDDGRCEPVVSGHEAIAGKVRGGSGIAAAMFNLGYLPGSDKSVITKGATTLGALEGLLPELRPGGVITLVLYRGHDGGDEEADAVMRWSESLDGDELRCAHYRTFGGKARAPELIAVSKLSAT